MNPAPSIIEAHGICRVFETGGAPVQALRGVDLRVETGEFVAVMGPSGSGKSTLLHILGCLDRPTQGTYLLEGRNVADLPDRDLSRLRADRIGFVFQTFNLVPLCTVIENVAMPFLYQESPPADVIARAEQALDRVGLADRRFHAPNHLSGGEMQRAAIARAVAIRPALVLADEPTGNLDSTAGDQVLDLFFDLNAEGVTVLMVTHNERLAARCHRVVRLTDGRIASDGGAP